MSVEKPVQDRRVNGLLLVMAGVVGAIIALAVVALALPLFSQQPGPVAPMTGGPTPGYGGPRWGGMGGPGMGGMGPGMGVRAGTWRSPGVAVNNEDDVRRLLENYLSYYGGKLVVKEVEPYTNNFYVIVWDSERDIGAFELIVHRDGRVMMEPQSMMWNTVYGMHSRGFAGSPTISLDEARNIAQEWVDANFPGGKVVEAYVFPGYYTFHFSIDGEMQMLSVNAYTGQVWFHWWHGGFLGEAEEEHEG